MPDLPGSIPAADSQNAPAPPPAAPTGNAPATDARDINSPSSRRRIILWLLAVAAAVPLAWLLVEQCGRPFTIPREITAGLSSTASADETARVAAAKRVRDSKNLSVMFSLTGAVLGLVFGVAAAFARRSWGAAAVGLIAGLAVGGVFGAAGGWVVGFIGDHLQSLASLEVEHKIIIGHLTGWAITGMGVGLASSLVSRRLRTITKGILAGFGGGLIGGALYVPLTTIAIPTIDTTFVIPETSLARFVWIAIPAACIGLGLGRALAACPTTAAPCSAQK